MFLINKDNSVLTLKSMKKRVLSFADKDCIIDKEHKLWIAWSNYKLFLDACPDYKIKPKKERKLKRHNQRMIIDMQYNIHLLTKFALVFDAFCEKNMLSGDKTVAKILYEWDMYLNFNPLLLND